MAWNAPFYNPAQAFIPSAAPQVPQSAFAPQSVPAAPVAFRCFPVTSLAQAEAFQIPFDGSTTYFADTSNGKIYAKTFDFNTGAAPIVAYVREQAAPAVQYATVEQLEAVMAEIEALKKPVRKEKKNDSDE